MKKSILVWLSLFSGLAWASAPKTLLGVLVLEGKDAQNQICRLRLTYRSGRPVGIEIEGRFQQHMPRQTVVLEPAEGRVIFSEQELAELAVVDQGSLFFGHSLFVGSTIDPQREWHRSVRLTVDYSSGYFQFQQALYRKPRLRAHRTHLDCQNTRLSRS